jgi:hypothetical protein
MAKPDRTPKKIAGLKLPKSIRQAPAVRSLLATAAGRKLFADALMEGAATAAARVVAAHEAAKAVRPDSADPKPKRARAAKPAPGAAPANDVVAGATGTLAPLDGKLQANQNGSAKPGAAD